MGSQHQDLYAQGSGPWALRKYKEYMLASLNADLAALESKGLTKEQCDRVKAALARGAALIGNIPTGGPFRLAFSEELDQFATLYRRWNGDDLPDPNVDQVRVRASAIQAMKKHRERMWDRLPKIKKRSNVAWVEEQLDLFANLDRDAIDEMHLAFAEVADKNADLFPTVGRAVAKYRTLM